MHLMSEIILLHKTSVLHTKPRAKPLFVNTSTYTAMFTDFSGFSDTKIDKTRHRKIRSPVSLVLQGSNTLTSRC